MNLTSFALKYKPIVLGVTLLCVAWGLVTYFTAPRREDPQFIIREATITTEWPGATAEQVEKQVSDKIEEACANIKQIRRTQSTSFPGRSVVQVTTVDAVTDVSAAWTKIRADLKILEPSLPEGCSSPNVNDNFGETAVLVLALYQDQQAAQERRYTPRELEIYAKRLRDRILDLRPEKENPDGRIIPVSTQPAFVMRLDMYGVQKEVIYLEVDYGRWSQLNLKSDDLQELLSQRNVIAASGTINTKSSKVSTRISGDFDATEEVNRVVIGRVATGMEGRDRQTIGELMQNIGSGKEPGGPRPTSQTVPVYLNDVGIVVKRQYEDPPQAITRISDGEISSECIVLSFTMKPGENISTMSSAVNDLLANANETFLPPDIRILRIADPPLAVENKINEVVSNLTESVVVVLIILIMLAGFRVAFVTATAIPLVMLTTIGLMRFWDIQIEQISLAALIVALGLLVDNATVVCDNTNRYLRMGLSQYDATLKGPSEISSSMLMSTLTTIAVFIPMTFCLTGGTQEYVFSLPVVVTIALLVSWLFALTVTAIMNLYLLAPSDGKIPVFVWATWLYTKLFRQKPKPHSDEATSEKTGIYISLCLMTMRHRWIMISLFFGLLFLSMLLPIKSSFFPNSDRPTFVVDVYLPEGSPIERTKEIVQRVEKMIQRLNNKTRQDGLWVDYVSEEAKASSRLLNMGSFIGTGGPRFFTGLDPGSAASNYAILWVNLLPNSATSQYLEDLRYAVWNGIGKPGEPDYMPPIAGARIIPKPLVLGTPVPSPIDYRLLGPRLANENVLRHFGQKIKDVLESSGLVWDIHDSWGELGEQLNVNIRHDQANMAGVTRATIAQAFNTYYTGHPLTIYREGDHQVPIKLRLPPSQRRSLAKLGAIYVDGYSGKVPLNAVADLEMKKQPIKITRYQRERIFGIRCRPENGILARDVLNQLEPQIKEIEAALPPGYRIENGGIEEEAIKGEQQNAVSLSVGAGLILLCLIMQYNSWIKPLIIILTVPLSIIGGLIGLYLLNIPMGFMETLGFLALFGTVMNAAILMVDFSEKKVQSQLASGEGLAAEGEKSCSGLQPAIFHQCVADAGRIRMMPIIMTTLTTIGGLISLIIGGGPLFKGLATVFAFGLAIGTTITLFALPAILTMFVQDLGLQLGAEKTKDEH